MTNRDRSCQIRLNTNLSITNTTEHISVTQHIYSTTEKGFDKTMFNNAPKDETLMNGTEYIEHLMNIDELRVLSRDLIAADGTIYKDAVYTREYAVLMDITHVLVSWSIGTRRIPNSEDRQLVVHNELIRLLEPDKIEFVIDNVPEMLNCSHLQTFMRYGVSAVLEKVYLIPKGDLLK